MKHITSLGLLAAFSLVSASASADVAERQHRESGDYYAFTDDLLHSDVMDGAAPRIVVRVGATRVMLHRPRASFVLEMLKSVEEF